MRRKPFVLTLAAVLCLALTTGALQVRAGLPRSMGGSPSPHGLLVGGPEVLAAASSGRTMAGAGAAPKYTCSGAQKTLFNNWNTGAVSDGGTPPSFTVSGGPYCLYWMATYNFNSGEGTSSAGMIGLSGVGSWQATGQEASGAPNANWIYYGPGASSTGGPGAPIILTDGSYACSQSPSATWSTDSEADGEGFCEVYGIPAVQKCECSKLSVKVVSESNIGTNNPKASAILIDLKWTLDCTGGTGTCSGTVDVDKPKGAAQTKFQRVEKSKGKTVYKKARNPVTCDGQCGTPPTSTSGTLRLVWHFDKSPDELYADGAKFDVATDCAQTGPTIYKLDLKFTPSGRLDRKTSTLS